MACKFRGVGGEYRKTEGRVLYCLSVHAPWKGPEKVGRGVTGNPVFPFVFEVIHFKDSQEIGLWILWEWVVSHMIFPLPGMPSPPPIPSHFSICLSSHSSGLSCWFFSGFFSPVKGEFFPAHRGVKSPLLQLR